MVRIGKEMQRDLNGLLSRGVCSDRSTNLSGHLFWERTNHWTMAQQHATLISIVDQSVFTYIHVVQCKALKCTCIAHHPLITLVSQPQQTSLATDPESFLGWVHIAWSHAHLLHHLKHLLGFRTPRLDQGKNRNELNKHIENRNNMVCLVMFRFCPSP